MAETIFKDIPAKNYDFLVELAEKMKTQSNRGTQDVAFMVLDNEKTYVTEYDDYDGKEKDDDDNDVYYTLEARKQTKAGIFLTAEACQNHIDENRHHYTDDVSVYGVHIWRNPEMLAVIDCIFAIAGIEKPRRYSSDF